MLEGDGKPKSINLNRILFFFFVLCFSFKLFFLISLGVSLVLQVAHSISGESFPLSLLIYFKFLSSYCFFPFFFPSSFSPRNQLHHPFNSDGGSCTHTLIRQLNWVCRVGNEEFTAFCSPKSQTLPSPSACGEENLWERSGLWSSSAAQSPWARHLPSASWVNIPFQKASQ